MRIILTVVILLTLSLSQLHSQSHPDHAALKALYMSTDGDNWTDNSGWTTGINDSIANPCDGWKGIDCINDRVTFLGLFDNGLSGPIPSEIGQ